MSFRVVASYMAVLAVASATVLAAQTSLSPPARQRPLWSGKDGEVTVAETTFRDSMRVRPDTTWRDSLGRDSTFGMRDSLRGFGRDTTWGRRDSTLRDSTHRAKPMPKHKRPKSRTPQPRSGR